MSIDSLDPEARSLMPPPDTAGEVNVPTRKPLEIVLYDAMPHGFHVEHRPSDRGTAVKDGWQRLRAWCQQNGVA